MNDMDSRVLPTSTDNVELFTSPILIPTSLFTAMRLLTAFVAIVFSASEALEDEIAEEIDWRALPMLPAG